MSSVQVQPSPRVRMPDQVQPWFAYDGTPFKGTESYFFERKDFPWVQRIESQWKVIRDELMTLVQEHEGSLTPYANRDMTSRPNKWKTFGFMFWTVKSKKNYKKCPKTWELLNSIPGILAGSFNLLEAGTTIKPHYGDTNAIVRCHLGLVIPGPAPQCAFRVGAETRGWKEGEFLLFCDAHPHTAWNNTAEKRYILLLDIIRPEYASRKTEVCSRVLAGLNLEIAYQRSEWLRKKFNTKKRKAMLYKLLRHTIHFALKARLPIPSLPS